MDSLIKLVQLGGVGFLITAALFYLNEACVVFVPAFTAVLLLDKLSREERVITSGWNLKRPWEVVVKAVKTKSENVSFKFSVILGDSQGSFDLKISFFKTPSAKPEHLIQYCKLESKTREDAAIDRVRSMAQIKLEECKTLNEVLLKQKELEEAIEVEVAGKPGEVSKLEERIGETIDRVAISNVELDPEVKAAENALVAQESINARRKKEMSAWRDEAEQLVDSSKKRGVEMPLERALDMILSEQGKGGIKKNIQVLEVDPGTRNALIAFAGAILGKLPKPEKEDGDGQH